MICFSVVNHLLQYFYKYTSTILDDAEKVSSHSKKEMIDADDIKFAVKVSSFLLIIKTLKVLKEKYNIALLFLEFQISMKFSFALLTPANLHLQTRRGKL